MGNICKLSVDGTDCPINEPQPFNTCWFTKKFNGPGLRYEIALNIRTGEICWINGPFQCGSWPDGNIFMNDLYHELQGNEMVQADKGYKGRRRCWTWYNQPTQEERDIASRVRARHETVNSRFKTFKALSTPFRHPRSKHILCFRAAATIVQLEMRHDSPLFQIDYRETGHLEKCQNAAT